MVLLWAAACPIDLTRKRDESYSFRGSFLPVQRLHSSMEFGGLLLGLQDLKLHKL